MLLAIVFEGTLYASGILVIVVDASLLGMTATGIKPYFRVTFDRVHTALLKWIEEHNAVERHADRPMGNRVTWSANFG